jgi:peptidoglycan hydrolase-like protein with peptidoglycan-binding domain
MPPPQGGTILTRFRRPLSVALLLVAVMAVGASAPVLAHKRAVFPAQSLGSNGLDVTALQHLLRARGHTIPANGVFGGSTQAAVAGFQKAAGVAVTGVADTDTWQQLVPQLRDGSTGEAVIALQKQLNGKRKADLAVSGSFDAGTRNAVRTFQEHMGLSVTGVVNVSTWRNLLWHYLKPVFKQPGLCNYNGGNAGADWGTGSTVGLLTAAAALFNQRTAGKIAVGDISWEHGGNIVLHATHEVGLDVDIALVRKDRNQCRRPGIDYKSAQYDRSATRQLIQAIYDAAPNQVQLIYFNDPVLIREGLVERYRLHNDHIHVRYCEVGHAQARYRCAAPALDSAPLEVRPDAPPDRYAPAQWEWLRPVLIGGTAGATRI